MIWYIIAALCWLLVAGALAERMFVTNKLATALSLILAAAGWPLSMPLFAFAWLRANRKREILFTPPFAGTLTEEGLEWLKKALEEQ